MGSIRNKLFLAFIGSFQPVERIVNRNIEAPKLEAVRVYGDRQALKQAIRVFLDNAQKYTEDGDTIRISCENRQGDCVITVEDTGIGMRGKDLDNIFSRF